MPTMPLFSEEYLAHHGISGQKWGQKNGPPYPLGSSQLSAKERKLADKADLREKKATERKEKKTQKKAAKIKAQREKQAAEAEQAAKEKEEAKQRILRSGDAKQIEAIRDELTTNEIYNAMNRVDAYQKLNALTKNQVQNGFNAVDRTMANVGKVANWLTTANNLYTQSEKAWQNSKKLYKDIEKAMNRMTGTDFDGDTVTSGKKKK